MNYDEVWNEMYIAAHESLTRSSKRKPRHTFGGAGVIITAPRDFVDYMIKSKKAYYNITGCYIPVPLLTEDYSQNKLASEAMLKVCELNNISAKKEVYKL
jgi:hypothetical protein